MSRARWIAALVLACTPHEHAQEPIAPCPADTVLVDAPQRFCLDVTEVSTAAYGACVHAGQCTPAIVGAGEGCNLTRADRGGHPINCVTAHQAAGFCGWLGKRVPTDEEWRLVARGGARETPFPWGRQPPDPTRACLDRAAHGTCEIGSRTAGASPEGALDLVGNVEEWVQLGDRWRRLGGGYDQRAVDPVALSALAPDRAADLADLAALTTGIRCAVAPHTPAQAIDAAEWTPYVPQPIELPTLAPHPVTAPPSRPASNFAILHRTPESNDPPRRWYPLGAGFFAGEPADPAALDLRDPLDRAALPGALQHFTPLRDLGAFVLMLDRSARAPHYIAFERATGKLRWQLKLADLGASYTQFIAPQVLVAVLYGDRSDQLIAWSLAGGREVWRLPGGESAPFTRVREAWSDDDRAYLLGDRGLVAFDPETGAILWSGVAVAEGCGVSAGDGELIVEDPAGHRLIDPATGAALRRLVLSTRRKPSRGRGDDTCRWGTAPWDGGLPGAVVEGDRMFAFDPPGPRHTATLRAFDLATASERWRRPGLGTSLLAADHDIVLAERTGEILVVLDADTGETRAEFSFAGPFVASVVPGGGEAGPLILVDSWNAGTWILGRAAAPAVPEVHTVRGRLVPDGISPKKVAGVPVRVGEQFTRSDERGRFEARGRALGAVSVDLGSGRGPDQPGGLHVRFESEAVVLEGRRSYDVGDLALHEWYIE